MSPRAWLAACLLAAFIGGVIGWSARVVTTFDRSEMTRIRERESRINKNNIEAETMIDAARARIEKERRGGSRTAQKGE